MDSGLQFEVFVYLKKHYSSNLNLRRIPNQNPISGGNHIGSRSSAKKYSIYETRTIFLIIVHVNARMYMHEWDRETEGEREELGIHTSSRPVIGGKSTRLVARETDNKIARRSRRVVARDRII